MQQRFEKKRNCIDKFTIMSNSKFLPIKVYDRMIIKINTSIEKSSITLLNVIYISKFTVNIVADNILKDKKLHFDIQRRHLHRNDFAVILTLRISAYYVLEDNKEFKKMFATFIQIDFTDDKH